MSSFLIMLFLLTHFSVLFPFCQASKQSTPQTDILEYFPPPFEHQLEEEVTLVTIEEPSLLLRQSLTQTIQVVLAGRELERPELSMVAVKIEEAIAIERPM